MKLKMKKIISLITSVMILCNMSTLVFGEAAVPPATPQTTLPTEKTEPVNPEMPRISSDSYLVMDAKTGQILLSKNPDKKQNPASTTKVLTTALALEVGVNPADEHEVVAGDTFPADYKKGFSGTTWLSITPTEVVTIEDLLYGTMIVSANDAANTLGNIAAAKAGKGVKLADGSTDYTAGFVQMMNEKVKELGAANTNFTNPHGLYNENHYTTAYDLALITRYAINVKTFQKYFSATEYTMPPTNIQSQSRRWVRDDEGMMQPSDENYFNGIMGIKLGYTSQSNHTGVSVAQRNGNTLIAVALNCPGANTYAVQNDMSSLLGYCFDNFSPTTFTPTDLNIDKLTVPVYDKKGEGHKIIGKASLSTSSDFTILLHKNYTKKDVVVSSDIPGRYHQNEEMPSTLTFSLKKTAENENNQYMVPDMAALQLQVKVVTEEDIAMEKAAKTQAIIDKTLQVLKYIGWTILVLLVLLIIIRIRNRYIYKKRKQKQRNAQSRRKKLQKK